MAILYRWDQDHHAGFLERVRPIGVEGAQGQLGICGLHLLYELLPGEVLGPNRQVLLQLLCCVVRLCIFCRL